MSTIQNSTDKLKDFFSQQNELELAFLVGSRADETSSPNSDWDFAIQWHQSIDTMTKLSNTETLRHNLATLLSESDIDLIDLPTAGLAIRETVANHGIILEGENTLKLSHFLLKTWREVEEFYWEDIYAI